MKIISPLLRERLVRRVLSALPEVVALYAHGSMVRGEPRPDSDLDLGLLLPPGAPASPRAWLVLAADLSAIAGRKVAEFCDALGLRFAS